MTTAHVVVDSPIEDLTLTSDGDTLTGVFMAEHRHTDRTGWGDRLELGDAPAVLVEAAGQLAAYFAGERTTFDLALGAAGTDFQQRVGSTLTQIPYGHTWSYAELARAAGVPGASRAVGMANGRNPISIVVPCHRVIGADGSLTGYGGGVARKQTLLDLERSHSGASLW